MHAVHSAGKFNQLVYQYPIRIPERFSLVIRSLLTQEGICFTLEPDFKFLEVNTLVHLLFLPQKNFSFCSYVWWLMKEYKILKFKYWDLFLFLFEKKIHFFFFFQMFDWRHFLIENNFLQVAYPYVAKRLLTDPNPALRERLIQVNNSCFLSFSFKSHFYHLNQNVWTIIY